jgi:hypothetical protein
MSHLKHAALAAVLLAGSVGCEKKLDEAQIRAKVLAEEAAKAADARVAKLEQELADLKSGKSDPKDGDKDFMVQAKADQKKALERQLAEQKKKAEARKQEALKLAEAKSAATATGGSSATPAPKPVVVEVPAGTSVSVSLGAALSTEKDKAGDLWQGTLAESVTAGGQTVWAAGTPVRGVVSQSVPAGRLASGKGALSIRLTEIGDHDVDGGNYMVTGGATGERNAKIIGGAAALGALIGVLSDRKNKEDHALGGAAIGAAAGTAAAAATAKTTIVIPADKTISFSLAAPEKVTLKKP